MEPNDPFIDPSTWLGTLVILIIALICAALIVLAVRLTLSFLGKRTPWFAELGRRTQLSGAVFVFVVVTWVVSAVTAPGDQPWWPGISHLLLIVAVIVGAWLATALVSFGFERLIAREETVFDAEARSRRTQLVVMQRLALVIIGIVALGAVLFSFPEMRVVGTSLLASAGLASIIAGLAAQSILGNLIAGIQLAFTDAIKVGDVVVAEGEWGRIGEINLSYVVLYIWDERRLILPCSYFTTQPFETWTRTGDPVLGLVYMDLDWRVPMEPVRAKFQEIIEGSDAWDRRSSSVWVTGSEGGRVTVRFAMSTANSDDQWVLQCTVREEIMTWLQREHPEVLPVTRVEVTGA